jgi:hypothetical protein
MGISLAKFVRDCYGHIAIIIIDDGTYIDDVQTFFLGAKGSGFAYLLKSHLPQNKSGIAINLETAIDHVRAGNTVIQDLYSRSLTVLNRKRPEDNILYVYTQYSAVMRTYLNN